MAEIKDLMSFFHGVASEGTPEEALAAFYAYESQVPRVAAEKARGLREMYGADEQDSAATSRCTAPRMCPRADLDGSNWPGSWSRIRKRRSVP